MGKKTIYSFGSLLHPKSRLTYLQDAEPKIYNNGQRKRLSYFACTCGSLVKTSLGDVKNGKSLSCGCYEKEVCSERATIHGKAGTAEYMAWKDMLRRCYNEHLKVYPYYGGRGIEVCDRWQEDNDGLKNFIDDMGERPEGCSLDRIDTDGHYLPSNCRWTDGSNQIYNRRPLKANMSGVTGVCFDKQTGQWMAYIRKGKMHNLGRHARFEDAVSARKEAELRLYGYNLKYKKE